MVKPDNSTDDTYGELCAGGKRGVPAGAGKCRISPALGPSDRPEAGLHEDCIVEKNSNLWHVGVHVLLEVHGEELKDEVELGLLHQNVLEGDDVRVLQLLQQRYLADGS